MRVWFASLVMSVVLSGRTPAPVQANAATCSEVFATLLSNITESDSQNVSQRFELRRCPGGEIQVQGWERGASKPTVSFNTGGRRHRVLYHQFNVLILQTLGGASDHVYVFTFESGIPKLALKTATKDEISVHGERNGREQTVVVEVPPTTYPENGRFPPTPKPKVYRFRVTN